MKYYYDTNKNKYVALHQVTPKDIPAGYMEISETEYNEHYLVLEFDAFHYGDDELPVAN